jgi:threonine dehydrogenase-like Zn-dependent dehydrogenase
VSSFADQVEHVSGLNDIITLKRFAGADITTTDVQVGMYRGKHPEINMMEVCVKQLNMRGKAAHGNKSRVCCFTVNNSRLGTIRYTTNCFEEAVSMIDRDLVDVKSLVSHIYDFKDSLLAFETVYDLTNGQGENVLKTVILHGDT